MRSFKSRLLLIARKNIGVMINRSVYRFNWISFLPVIIPIALLAVAIAVSAVNGTRVKMHKKKKDEKGEQKENNKQEETSKKEEKDEKVAENNPDKTNHTYDKQRKSIESNVLTSLPKKTEIGK